MFPATFHENIVGTFAPAINRILCLGHHRWGHRNQREEPCTIDFLPFANELFIFYCIKALSKIGETLLVEERAMLLWRHIYRPEFLREDADNFIPPDVISELSGLTKKQFFDKFSLFHQIGAAMSV
jgi:hypothetical protein